MPISWKNDKTMNRIIISMSKLEAQFSFYPFTAKTRTKGGM